MRTSRPQQKHAPKPLLASATSKSKGKGRAAKSDNDAAGSSRDIYSFAPQNKGKGIKRAEQRLREARQDVDVSFSRGGRANKGKQRAQDAEQNGEDSDAGDEDDDDDLPMQDIRNIKFKMGLGSDDEQGFGEDDDDEEIDSDMADTDGEDAAPSKSRQSKVQKASAGRQRATDFYSDEEEDDDDDEDDDDEENDADDPSGFPEVDLNEDDSFTTLDSSKAKSALKKQKAKSSAGEATDLKSFKPSLASADTESEDDVEDDEDEDEEDQTDDDASDISEDDDDEDDPETLSRLQALINGLPGAGTKRSRGDEEEDATRIDASNKRRKHQLGQEKTEALPEGEYVATGSGKGKLTIDSMLSSLTPQQAKSLRSSLKPLVGSSSEHPDDASIEAELARLSKDEAALLARERAKQAAQGKNPLKAPGALPAPLPASQQAKIERQAAKEKLDEEVKKWDETVLRMRGVSKEGADLPESRLVLPLMAQGPGKGTSSAELVAKFNPQNDLERQVFEMINANGLSQSSLIATENEALMSALPENASERSQAHDRARIAQLRLSRELMFRTEQKAKRIAKIKSRTFRKIAKRQRAREADADGEGNLTIEEMAELDALDGGMRAEKERERLEILRAKERATLRHASGASSATAGGRWSRGLRGLDGMDDNIKDAIRQRESKQELLRRKILGRDDEDPNASPDEDADAQSDDDQDESAIKNAALQELEALKTNGGSSAKAPKGLMSMKFMQRAVQREDSRLDGVIDDFKMQVEDEAGADAQESSVANHGIVQENPGRMVFSASAPTHAAPADGVGEEQTERKRRKPRSSKGNTSRSTGTVTTQSVPPSATSATIDYNPFSQLSSSKAEARNPWLAVGEGSASQISRKTNETLGGKAVNASDKATARLKKDQSKSKAAQRLAASDAHVDIDVEQILMPKSAGDAAPTSPPDVTRKGREGAPPPSSAVAKRHAPAIRPTQPASDDDDDEDALPESLKRNPQAFRQRELVSRAFAGDDVVADFEEMKRQEIEADAPREEDLTLPGWGSWGGKGVRKSKNAKKIVKRIPGVDASARKDAKLQHVILSEKKDKKAAKYMTKDLPFPYTSKAQFEQKLAMPTGVEWTTRSSHQDMTMPRVLTKPGAVIKPIIKAV